MAIAASGPGLAAHGDCHYNGAHIRVVIPDVHLADLSNPPPCTWAHLESQLTQGRRAGLRSQEGPMNFARRRAQGSGVAGTLDSASTTGMVDA